MAALRQLDAPATPAPSPAPAAGPRPPLPATALDAGLLDRLAGQLADGDLAAGATLAALGAGLDSRHGEPVVLERLAALVGDFDFDAAAAELAAWRGIPS